MSKPCNGCQGRGKISCAACHGSGTASFTHDGYCQQCRGAGIINCYTCNGSGKEWEGSTGGYRSQEQTSYQTNTIWSEHSPKPTLQQALSQYPNARAITGKPANQLIPIDGEVDNWWHDNSFGHHKPIHVIHLRTSDNTDLVVYNVAISGFLPTTMGKGRWIFWTTGKSVVLLAVDYSLEQMNKTDELKKHHIPAIAFGARWPSKAEVQKLLGPERKRPVFNPFAVD